MYSAGRTSSINYRTSSVRFMHQSGIMRISKMKKTPGERL